MGVKRVHSNPWPFTGSRKSSGGPQAKCARRSSLTVAEATKAAYKAGSHIGDTDGFQAWLCGRGLQDRGAVLVHRLRREFERGVEGGGSGVDASPARHTTAKAVAPARAPAQTRYKGYQIGRTTDGDWFSSLDPDSHYESEADLKRAIDEYRRGRGQNPRKKLSPRPTPPSDGRAPDTGQYIYLKTDDGKLYWTEDFAHTTHVAFARKRGVPSERIVGGGWITNGVMSDDSRSDSVRYGERGRASMRVGQYLNPRPKMTRDELERMDTADLDRMAFGFASGDTVSVPLSRLTPLEDDLDNAKYKAERFSGGPKAWAKSVDFSEPIEVKLKGGKWLVWDGNHRYYAAKLLGKKSIRATVEIEDNSIEAILRKHNPKRPKLPAGLKSSATQGKRLLRSGLQTGLGVFDATWKYTGGLPHTMAHQFLDSKRNPGAIWVSDPDGLNRVVHAQEDGGFVFIPQHAVTGLYYVYAPPRGIDLGNTRPDAPASLTENSRIGSIRFGAPHYKDWSVNGVRMPGKYTDTDTSYLYSKSQAHEDALFRNYKTKAQAAKAIVKVRKLEGVATNPEPGGGDMDTQEIAQSIAEHLELTTSPQFQAASPEVQAAMMTEMDMMERGVEADVVDLPEAAVDAVANPGGRGAKVTLVPMDLSTTPPVEEYGNQVLKGPYRRLLSGVPVSRVLAKGRGGHRQLVEVEYYGDKLWGWVNTEDLGTPSRSNPHWTGGSGRSISLGSAKKLAGRFGLQVRTAENDEADYHSYVIQKHEGGRILQEYTGHADRASVEAAIDRLRKRTGYTGGMESNPAKGMTGIWGRNRVTGYWQYLRDSLPENAAEWVRVWSTDSRYSEVIASKNKPADKRRRSNPAKFDRCVRDVQARGGDVNAYAVCTAAGTRNPKSKDPSRTLTLKAPLSFIRTDNRDGLQMMKPGERVKVTWNQYLGSGRAYIGSDWMTVIKAADGPNKFKGWPAEWTDWRDVPEQSNPRHSRRNPALFTLDDSPEAADELYERFHGKEPEDHVEITTEVVEPDHLTSLGSLVSLKVATPTGFEVELGFEDDPPYLCSDTTGRQLYIEGGSQAIDLKALGMSGKDWERPNMVLGDLVETTYRTQKKFDKFQTIDYYHANGEESGVLPQLLYDPENQILSIAGGRYKVKPEGIVD